MELTTPSLCEEECCAGIVRRHLLAVGQVAARQVRAELPAGWFQVPGKHDGRICQPQSVWKHLERVLRHWSRVRLSGL